MPLALLSLALYFNRRNFYQGLIGLFKAYLAWYAVEWVIICFLYLSIYIKMDVGMHVTTKFRNHLTDHHETWHMEEFFLQWRFLCYPFYFHSSLGGLQHINFYTVRSITTKFGTHRYQKSVAWKIFYAMYFTFIRR